MCEKNVFFFKASLPGFKKCSILLETQPPKEGELKYSLTAAVNVKKGDSLIFSGMMLLFYITLSVADLNWFDLKETHLGFFFCFF